MSGFDPVFNPTRLAICAYLSGCQQGDFSAVQEYCGLSQSTLSKALTQLTAAGYVEVTKASVGRYSKTVLALTEAGREALASHLDALQRIAIQARRTARASTEATLRTVAPS
ncbi:transcriptional regulator [Tersicoccus sp. MR15.9]|uniref:transcriptional regulator n=1 Tax=Tersicoccus mangrovi TaxID=3121635 RepID=UPI002FE6291F